MNDDREFEQLESQLRNALARKDVPDGFEERVRALAAADPEPERLSWWSRVVTPAPGALGDRYGCAGAHGRWGHDVGT
jgi:hypothetical protein